MPLEVIMPKLGLTMTEGKIVEWRKQEGEAVRKGEVLYVLETEKVTYEVEAPQSGTLGKVLVGAGQTVPVGTVVALLLATGEAPLPATPAPAEEVRVSPLARRLAQEHGVDLSGIKGTGPEGRVVKEDVLRAVAEKQATPPPAPAPPTEEGEKIIPLSAPRRTAARRMTQSFQQAPHFWLTVEADALELERAQRLLAPSVEAASGEHLTLTDLLVKVCAQALRDCPEVNATWTGEGVKLLPGVHIGVATATEMGLLVPVLRDADQKALAQIAKERADLVRRAREGKLLPDDLTGSTFTLSNMGVLGIDQGNAILNPPEAALLFVGRVIEKPVVMGGQVVVRPRMSLTLSLDHRVLDGATGGRFLVRIKELIEQPGLASRAG